MMLQVGGWNPGWYMDDGDAIIAPRLLIRYSAAVIFLSALPTTARDSQNPADLRLFLVCIYSNNWKAFTTVYM
jgi:hypothetical protein